MAIRKRLKGLATRLLRRSANEPAVVSRASQSVSPAPRKMVLETDDAGDDSLDIEVDSALVDDWLTEGRPLIFVDIREVVEMVGGHIEGAHLLPMSDLDERMDELPKDRELVVYCAAGARSYGVAHQLRDHGYSSFSMVGGIGSWLSQGGIQVVPGAQSPLRPVDMVCLTQEAARRFSGEPRCGTVQEIRTLDGVFSYTIYSDGERLSGLAIEDLVAV